jgi:phosphate transport system protein
MMPNAENHRDLYQQLKTEMSAVGRDVNQSIQQALEALEKQDVGSAEKVLGRIETLHQREEALKEICLKILASANGNTPEMRWTGCAHRILALIGNISAEIAAIAEQVEKIKKGPAPPIAKDLPEMGRMASQMLERSIQTALHPDAEDARRIMEEDSSLDKYKDDFAKKAIAITEDNPDRAEPVLPYVLVSRHLERIGDHASHIAEEVAYYLKAQAS